MKVMTILGTRPEIIRLSEVIKELDQRFEHILVHTGQNYDYELNGIFFEELGLRKPDVFLEVDHSSLGKTMGEVISKAYDLIKEVQPDAVLILGDTNSALSAIAAKRLKCPLFHMEAGNRCGDWNVAEMTNRVIVDHIADFNLPYSHYAYNNLLREGLDPNFIEVTGSPMKEVLLAHKDQFEHPELLSSLGLEDGRYLLLSAHREENIDIDKNFNKLFPSLNEVIRRLRMKALFSVHPRTRKKLTEKGFEFDENVILNKPFGYFEYIYLQRHAYCVLSDSGSVSEESSILDFPAVLIRTSTERQEAELFGSIEHSGLEADSILKAIEKARKTHPGKPTVPDYDVVGVAKKVADCIERNVSRINLEIWDK